MLLCIFFKAKALEEKNERDRQAQREQAERHVILNQVHSKSIKRFSVFLIFFKDAVHYNCCVTIMIFF